MREVQSKYPSLHKGCLFILSLFIVFALVLPQNALASYNPTIVPNNHFGMGILDTNELPEIAKLVNSNGGDWGYVTLVIQKGERDTVRWQRVMDEMRRLHLIPIVRIATAPLNGDIWEKPSMDEIDGWVGFLNSLNWVIKNRYVVVGNEPNHAKEWGGEVNASEYATYLKTFSQKLKSSNDDYFIMPAPMDASATTFMDSRIKDKTIEEATYLKQMVENDVHVFDNIDGWASHSYPNPNFSGSGSGSGRGTVRTYEWELDYLHNLGVSKNLPVFVTETGWVHGNDLVTNIGPKFDEAYRNTWNDKRIIAVTPFIFNYTTSPFNIFSWKLASGQYYDFYYTVLGLNKIKGEPIQNDSGEIISGIFPKIVLSGVGVNGVLFARNTGQAIWNRDGLAIDDQNFKIASIFPLEVEPNHIAAILVNRNLPEGVASYDMKLVLTNNFKKITDAFESKIIIISKIPVLSDVFGYIKSALARKVGLE